MLPQKYRFRSSRDFSTVYKYGRKARGKHGMLISLSPQTEPTGFIPPQFGFVVSKKVGNSVVRHKLTRQLRALSVQFAKQYEKSLSGYKFSFIAYLPAARFDLLESEYNSLMSSLLVLPKGV